MHGQQLLERSKIENENVIFIFPPSLSPNSKSPSALLLLSSSTPKLHFLHLAPCHPFSNVKLFINAIFTYNIFHCRLQNVPLYTNLKSHTKLPRIGARMCINTEVGYFYHLNVRHWSGEKGTMPQNFYGNELCPI